MNKQRTTMATVGVMALALAGCPQTNAANSNGGPASDASVLDTDGGNTIADGGNGTPDGGSAAADSGTSLPDGGTGTPDSGGVSPDGGNPGTPDGGGVEECYGGASEEDLPQRVIFRSRKMTFNQKWYAALRDGHIYVKPNAEAGEPAGTWQMLGSGLPSGPDVSRFPAPTEIIEISGDGTWLHALSPAGVFYRGTDFTQNITSSFTWSDAWGHPAATGPGITTEFPTTHGWSVSDSQGAGVNHYEDRLGTVHSVGLGVAHIYRMGATGRSLIFNDWWLPHDWSRQICLPDRGTFFVENMSASASTILVIGTLGQMYTRLYDFDTSGENDTLTYSFAITGAAGDTRALPAEEWRQQPAITDGLITSRITIFQDGQGNAARMLRVEGVQQGQTGFYFKHIFDSAWSFEQTGHRVCGPFLNAPGRSPAPPVNPADVPLTGTLAVNRALGTSVSVGIRVRNFNIVCSPAEAQLLVGGQVVTVGGQPLLLPLHHVHSLLLTTRPTDYWQNGDDAVLRAALLVPAIIAQIDDATARQAVTDLLEDRRVVNFKGSASLTGLSLSEMTWLDPLVGVVPGDEKTDPGNEIKLEAAP